MFAFFSFSDKILIKEIKGEKIKMKHKWTEKDDIIVYYLYKFGTKNLTFSIEELGKKLGIKPESMKMRIENFRAIDTKNQKGLKNYAKLSKRIYEEYKNFSEHDLRNIVISLLKS